MERQYTEHEVTQVIRRAAELQERLAPSDIPRPGGIGERELVRIAGELGLEERFVRDALADKSTFAPQDKGAITSWDRTLERTAAGLPGSEAFEVALDEFGPTTGISSSPTTVGDTLTYQSMAGWTHCEMLVSKKGGRTRVKVGASTFLPFIGLGLPMGLALFIVIVALTEYATVAGLPILIADGLIGLLGVVLIWVLVRKFNAWSNRKVAAKLDALVERINAEAERVSESYTEPHVEQANL